MNENSLRHFSLKAALFLLFSFASFGAFAQTLSFDPAPSSGFVEICEGGGIIVTVNGTANTEEYQLYLQPDNTLLQTKTASGSSLVFDSQVFNTAVTGKFL